MDALRQVKIEGLYSNIEIIKRAIQEQEHSGSGVPKWRRLTDKYSDPEIEISKLREYLFDQEQELIHLERENIDPIQVAEMRAELVMESRFEGIDQETMFDNMNFIGQTPYEEKRFQDRIWKQARYDDEGYDPYYQARCLGCGHLVDEFYEVVGHSVCESFCYDEACAWAAFIAFVTNHAMLGGPNSEWSPDVSIYDLEDYKQWELDYGKVT